MRFPILRMAALGIFIASSPYVVAQDAPPSSEYGSKEAAAAEAKLLLVDQVPGYAGAVLGAAFSLTGYELDQDRGKLKIYKKTDEKLLMGPALLESVLYYIFDGKLYGVAFHTSDGQDSLALKSVLIFGFGPGQDSSDGGPSTAWIGKKNGVLFDLNTATGDGSAFLFNHDLHDAYLADQSASAQAAAQQLIKGK